MQKLIGVLLFIFFYNSQLLPAQKQTTFYLIPHIGIEWPISKFENSLLNPENVKGVNMSTSDKWGIALEIDFNNKWNLDIGFGRGNMGLGARFDHSTQLITRDSRSNTFVTVRRGYLSISKPIKLIEIKKKNHTFLDPLLKINKEFGYWAVFDINALGGLSYGYIPLIYTLDSTGNLSLNGNNDSKTYIYRNRNGVGAYAGFYFQFYKNQKKRLRLGIIYQQGFKKRLVLNWKTSLNGVEQPDFQMFTRDSMVAIYLAYPIKLFAIKEKGTIKGK